MEDFQKRLCSDINLLLNSIESFELLFPIGYKFLLEYADRQLFDVALDLMYGNGFSREQPLECVSNNILFQLFKCLERNVSTYKEIYEGKLLKKFKISIPPYRDSIFKCDKLLLSIYNINDDIDKKSYYYRIK